MEAFDIEGPTGVSGMDKRCAVKMKEMIDDEVQVAM